MIRDFMIEFMIMIKIENHLNIKNERGGIFDIFINNNINVKLGLKVIIELVYE